MKNLHLLSGGNNGGIEILCKEYARFSVHENHFVFVWEGGIVCDALKKNGVVTYTLNEKKTNVLQLAFKIKKICKENQIDTIIVHHADVFIRFALVVLKTFNRKLSIVTYAHASAVDAVRTSNIITSLCKKMVFGYAFSIANHRIAISASVKNSMVDVFGLSPDTIDVIYNGVDIDEFMPAETQHRHTPKLIFVGRLAQVKGVQNTIKALSLLPKDLSYQFEIVGEGKYMPELKALVAEYRLEDKVIFSGNQSDIPDRLKSADVFVHIPEWEEGFGITIIEAMATGLVCVCNHRGAIPEIITDGVNGLLVPNDDAEALAQTLVYAMENSVNGNLDKIKINARKRVEDFSMDTFAQQLDQLLMEGC